MEGMGLMAGYTPTRRIPEEQFASMSRTAASHATKAAKIRALDLEGHARADIAAFLGISYQHVHNTLGPIKPATIPRPQPDEAPPASENDDHERKWGTVKVEADGRIQLPEQVLRTLSIRAGFRMGWKLEDNDTLTLMGPEAGLRFVQDMARQYWNEGDELWSDQLIRERREESAREEADAREHHA